MVPSCRYIENVLVKAVFLTTMRAHHTLGARLQRSSPTFIMISMKKYGEKNKIIFSPRFVSMEMVAIFDFWALKSCTHRRHTNEETYRSFFTFVA